MSPIARAAVIAVLAAVSPVVPAAPPPPEAPIWYETATVRARPIDQATVAVTVLEREDIEALNVATVGELLRYVPGVSVVPAGSRAGLTWAQIRGGDPNFTVVLVDGVPLNDSTDQLGGVVNLEALPAANVERIEVVRGPLSSFFGSTGLAGAINVITRRGGDAPHWQAGVAGGDDHVRQATLSGARAGERSSWFAGASHAREKGRIGDDEFEQLALDANGRIALGSSSELRLTGRWTSVETDDYPDASGGPELGSGETRHAESTDESFGADWSIGPQDRRHRLRLSAHRRDLERTSPAVLPPPPDFSSFVPASREDTRFTEWHLGWSWPALARANTRMDVGVELESESGDNDSVLFLPPEFGGATPGSYALDRSSAGAFADLLAERGRWLFEAGARVDAPEGFGSEWSPRAGVSFRPTDGTRLRVSAGRAFKLPSFFVLGSPPALGGNPDLRPEVAWGADAAVEQRFAAGRVLASLTAFAYRFEDLIDFDFATFQHVNRSVVDSRGCEAELAWQAFERFGLAAQLTRQKVDVRDSPDPLRHRPEWLGSLRVRWQPLTWLAWEIDGQTVSERFDEQIPVPERTTVEGYTVFGSALTWDPAPAWRVEARVDNLADEDYETFIGFPGPGRSFRLGLRWRDRSSAERSW